MNEPSSHTAAAGCAWLTNSFSVYLLNAETLMAPQRLSLNAGRWTLQALVPLSPGQCEDRPDDRDRANT